MSIKSTQTILNKTIKWKVCEFEGASLSEKRLRCFFRVILDTLWRTACSSVGTELR